MKEKNCVYIDVAKTYFLPAFVLSFIHSGVHSVVHAAEPECCL